MKKTEAGSGGKKGHSNMTHWDKTAFVKAISKKARRIREGANMTIPIPERVHNGATALDDLAEKYNGNLVPLAWRDTFTPNVIAGLNIASAFHCVLGELYGDYTDAPSELLVDRRDDWSDDPWESSLAVRNGFSVSPFRGFDHRRTEEVLLTQAWRNYLTPGGLS